MSKLTETKPEDRPTLSMVKTSIGRELGMRKAVYPRSRMTSAEQAHEIACMAEAYRLMDVLTGLRLKLTKSDAVSDLAQIIKGGGMPTDRIVIRYKIGPQHTHKEICAFVADAIIEAITQKQE